MKEIVIDPSRLSELEICPRQYHLRYEIEASLPREVKEYANEQELIEGCIGDLLAEEGTVKQVVAKNLEELDRVFQPDTVKDVVEILDNWLQERVLKGDLKHLNRSFTETFLLGKERIHMQGLFHQIEKLADGTIKATIFKGENRLYTHDWMVKTYLPLIYAMVIKRLYKTDKIVISYFMVKHGSEVWIEYNEVDWAYQKHMVAIQLNGLMRSREDTAIVGSHCSYCPRKSVCNDYKQFIMESFEIRNIHEFFNIGMEEILDYIMVLDAQRNLLNIRSTELKSILIQEMHNNGVEHEEHGKYSVGFEQKKTYDYDIESILEEINPEDHSKIFKVDRHKMKKYLDSLSEEDKMILMEYCNTRYFKPTLKIKDRKEGMSNGKFKDFLDF